MDNLIINKCNILLTLGAVGMIIIEREYLIQKWQIVKKDIQHFVDSCHARPNVTMETHIAVSST